MVTRQRQKELNKLRNNANELLRDQQAVLAKANSVLRDARAQATHLSREEWLPLARSTYGTRFAPSIGRGFGAGRLVAGTARDAVFGTVVPAFSSAVAAAVALSQTTRGGVGGSSEQVSALGKQADEVVKNAGRVATTAPKGGDKADRGSSAGGRAAKAAAAAAAAKQAGPTLKKAAKGVAGVKIVQKATRKSGPALKKAGKGAAAAKAAQKAGPTLRKAAKGTALAGAIKKAAPDKRRSGVGTGGVVGIALAALALVGIGYAVWQTLRADDDLWVADDEPEVPTTDSPTTI